MKKILIKKAEKTLTDRKSGLLAKSNKDVDIDIEGDDTDLIQGKIIATITSQLNFRDRESLDKIDKALSKIREGTFGQCEECEEPISDKRLEANPEFSHCISCAEQNELDAKNNRSRGYR